MSLNLNKFLPLNTIESIDILFDFITTNRSNLTKSKQLEIMLQTKKLKMQLYLKQKLINYRNDIIIEKKTRKEKNKIIHAESIAKKEKIKVSLAEEFLKEKDQALMNYKNPNSKIKTNKIGPKRSSNLYNTIIRSNPLKGLKYYPSKS